MASGQVEKQLLPTELKQQTVITEPTTLHKGFFRIGLIGSYSYIDRIFDVNGTKGYPLNSNSWARDWAVYLLGQYGITDRLQVLAQIPYNYSAYYYSVRLENPIFDTTISQSWNLKGQGLGDIELGADYQIVAEHGAWPSLVGRATLTLPSGRKEPSNYKSNFDYTLPVGYGAPIINLGITIRKIRLPFSFTVYGYYNYKFAGNKVVEAGGERVSFKDGDFYNFGGSFNFHLNDWIALQNDLGYFHRFSDRVEDVSQNFESWNLQYQPILNFQIKRFRLVETTTFSLAGKNSGADPTFIFILQYIL